MTNTMTALTQFVIRNLDTQFLISLSQSAGASHHSQSPYALGYIYGFTCGGFDTFRTVRQEDRLDSLIGVYEHVFEMEGAEYLRQSLDLKSNTEFRKGNDCGWEEMKRLLHRKESAIGLLRFLINGEITQPMHSAERHLEETDSAGVNAV